MYFDGLDVVFDLKGDATTVTPTGTRLTWNVYEPTGALVGRCATERAALEAVEAFARKNNRLGVYRVLPPTRYEVNVMALGVVSIPPPNDSGTLSLTLASYTAIETVQLTVSVERTGALNGAVAVDWAVAGLLEGQPTVANGSLSWAANEGGAKTFTVRSRAVLSDRIGSISLSNARALTSGVRTPAVSRATAPLTITNDTTAPNVPAQPTLVSSSSSSVVLTAAAPTTTGAAVAGLQWRRDGVIVTASPIPPGTFQDNSPVPGTTHNYEARAVDDAGNQSGWSAARSVPVPSTNNPPVWATNIPQQNLQIGAAVDIDIGAFVTGEQWIEVVTGALPPGVSLNQSTRRITGIPTTAGTYNPTFRAFDAPQSERADWLARISGPGVVWYHGFETDNEVNNFRWTPTIGNNPNGVTTASYTGLVRRITTDGTDKGTGSCCLEVVRLPGNRDGSDWWRPMAPLLGGTTTGNGRGVGNNDPGANGTLTRRAFSPTQGGNQTASFTPGRYGNAIYHSQGGYDGTEYYLQMRVKIDPGRWTGENGTRQFGKLIYLTRTDRSLTDQEINTETNRQAGGVSYFSMYRSGSPGLPGDPPGVSVHGNQPGTEFGTVGDGICRLDNNGGRLANCWSWPVNEWVTLLYHIRPGTSTGPLGTENGNQGNNDTLVEVWAARRGETSYTKIWNQPNVDLPFDVFHGHNAVIASIYEGGANGTGWYHRYDQLIFSKNFIPCPQV